MLNLTFKKNVHMQGVKKQSPSREPSSAFNASCNSQLNFIALQHRYRIYFDLAQHHL